MRFYYKAIQNGKIVKGKIEAEKEEDVKDYLKKKELFVIEIKKEGGNQISFLSAIFDRVNFSDIVNFTRQVAMMLNAGLTLIEALDILKKQTTKQSFKKIITDISEEIKAGNSFSMALKKYTSYFSHLYIALVRSGEASGKLAEILLKLADNLEKEREFKAKVKGSLIYPVIIIIAMIIVIFIMITFVLPRLLNLYKDFNIDLPLTTKLLIFISSFMTKFWPLVVGGALLIIIVFRNYLKTKEGKLLYDSTLLKIPVLKEVIKTSSLVDVTRTLSILIGSGVSILEALDIVKDTSENLVYQKAFSNIYKKVEKGVSLGTAMEEEEEIFPPILVQMTQVGEQTGHLDDTLGRISRYFEMESELAVKAMTTLIEPAILVFLGVGVGFLVMSVITPIYNLTSSFK
jgi:type IV pilus assembly protein PilC